ncbi:rhomboid family intramembrane serine protease, partial [Vibrio anguillarum]
MILFFIAVTAYVGSLILVKPAPSSLKSASISYIENLKLVWASICSGVFILFIFLFITNFSFVNVDESLYRTFVLSNDGEKVMSRPLQLVSHLFVHGNLLHLATNVIGLGIASTYERRVGAKRYLSVLVVGALSSIPSVLFYSDNTTVCGISGGVFGLAAAYFTD